MFIIYNKFLLHYSSSGRLANYKFGGYTGLCLNVTTLSDSGVPEPVLITHYRVKPIPLANGPMGKWLLKSQLFPGNSATEAGCHSSSAQPSPCPALKRWGHPLPVGWTEKARAQAVLNPGPSGPMMRVVTTNHSTSLLPLQNFFDAMVSICWRFQ